MSPLRPSAHSALPLPLPRPGTELRVAQSSAEETSGEPAQPSKQSGMASARPVLDREQTRKAVAALMKYIGKEKAEAKELFDDDEFLYVVRAEWSLHRAGDDRQGITPEADCRVRSKATRAAGRWR